MSEQESISSMLKSLLPFTQLSTATLASALDALPVGICCAAAGDRQILYVNRAFAELVPPAAEHWTTLDGWVGALPRGADREAMQTRLDAASSGHVQTEGTKIVVACRSGAERTVLCRCSLVPQSRAMLLALTDISECGSEDRPTSENERLSRALLAHSHEMIVIANNGEQGRFASPAVEEITGWTQQEYVARDLLDMVHPEDRAKVQEVRQRILQEGAQQHLRYRTLVKGGGYRWVEGFAAPYQDPNSPESNGYVVTLRDIAKQKEQEDTLAMENSQLAQLAQLDELTGIANRRVFRTALSREARRKSRSSQSLALLLLDVDNFKKYNDLYGHLQGDACLRQVAQTLKKVLHRVADLVARYGGEEFVMLLPMTEPDGAERVARNVLQAVSALRIPHAGTPHGIVTVSVGVSTWAATSDMDEERLIEEADRALYRAKNQGRNRYTISHCLPDPHGSDGISAATIGRS